MKTLFEMFFVFMVVVASIFTASTLLAVLSQYVSSLL